MAKGVIQKQRIRPDSDVISGRGAKGYEGLAIQEGGLASREYLRATFGEAPKSERLRVRSALEAYCGQDTEEMIWVAGALRKMTSP